ncbi:LEPR-XLL domain-containing protein, partial [Zoogloea sp.]|uniref:LEPR-XLL domain-containing protein n=1 Tax=Zoogloea sp. TaxID=49181 RepID=UPI002BE3D812
MSKRRRALIETFESRIMYSADPGPLGLAAAVLSGAEQQVADTGAAVQHGGSELVFIDARVPDVQSLLDDLAAQQRAGRA